MNILKNIYNKVVSIFFRKNSMEDPARVQAKVSELNLAETGTPWADAEGYYALTKVDWNITGVNTVFHANNGMPTKAFINTETGEIKTFLASQFETR